MNILSTTFHRRGVAKAFFFEIKPICTKREENSGNQVIWCQEQVHST